MACVVEEGKNRSDAQSHSDRQPTQTHTVQGILQKIEGDVYTIKDEQGGKVRLNIEEYALQGKTLHKGDSFEAPIIKSDESDPHVISPNTIHPCSQHQSEDRQAAHSGLMELQVSQDKGKFAKTIYGEVRTINENVYHVLD